jgi:hypothetical protein
MELVKLARQTQMEKSSGKADHAVRHGNALL